MFQSPNSLPVTTITYTRHCCVVSSEQKHKNYYNKNQNCQAIIINTLAVQRDNNVFVAFIIVRHNLEQLLKKHLHKIKKHMPLIKLL